MKIRVREADVPRGQPPRIDLVLPSIEKASSVFEQFQRDLPLIATAVAIEPYVLHATTPRWTASKRKGLFLLGVSGHGREERDLVEGRPDEARGRVLYYLHTTWVETVIVNAVNAAHKSTGTILVTTKEWKNSDGIWP